MKTKLGSKANVEQYFNNAYPHLQANYCHASFPSKIKFERIGKFIFVNGQLTASDKSIHDLRNFNIQNLGDADLIGIKDFSISFTAILVSVLQQLKQSFLYHGL